MANATTTSEPGTSLRARDQENGALPPGPGGGRPVGSGGSFFERYKPDQGTKVRAGTMWAGALLAFGAGKFLYDQLKSRQDPSRPWTLFLVYGLTVLVAAAVAIVAFHMAYRKRDSGDFLIATEGEMRKVNWSSRREVIGSTKVVIAFALIFALMMGVVDLVFFKAFMWIGVLEQGVSGLGDPGG
ncbi:MAG: preprotein translocase subunit SecE [Phycisphaerales bacterium]|nr:preprotein translocase subunit SecE [Phycisphaerales bacterium]